MSDNGIKQSPPARSAPHMPNVPYVMIEWFARLNNAKSIPEIVYKILKTVFQIVGQFYLSWSKIHAEVVNFWGCVEAIGLPAIQRGGCPTEK